MKKYTELEIEVIRIDGVDVIRCSGSDPTITTNEETA